MTPEFSEAWTAKPGETVFLRLSEPISRDAFEMARSMLDQITERSGVFFVILDPRVEVVNPKTGETA